MILSQDGPVTQLIALESENKFGENIEDEEDR